VEGEENDQKQLLCRLKPRKNKENTKKDMWVAGTYALFPKA
jgi:hypothetical protein